MNPNCETERPTLIKTTSNVSLLIALALSCPLHPVIAQDLPSSRIRVIFDTDITGDVDDVLALAMLHTLADRKQCELLAVTISKINELTGPFTDAVNTFYGRPDLRIGVTRDSQKRQSKYLHLINEGNATSLRYPHDIQSNDELPDAVALMRQVLASQPDHSVVIIQVGVAVNVAGLIQSPPDQFSPLSGDALIRRKVKKLSVMAGAFEPIQGDTHFLEANVRNHIKSMQTLAEYWPDRVPIIWSGFEIGIAVPYPRTSIHRDYLYTPHHIVRESYLLHSGPQHDRPTWDLTSVLEAIFPDRGYFELSAQGRVSIADDGFMTFTPNAKGRDRYLVLPEEGRTRVVEALTQMTSQPPRKADTSRR
jgi:purine nucleosidase